MCIDSSAYGQCLIAQSVVWPCHFLMLGNGHGYEFWSLLKFGIYYHEEKFTFAVEGFNRICHMKKCRSILNPVETFSMCKQVNIQYQKGRLLICFDSSASSPKILDIVGFKLTLFLGKKKQLKLSPLSCNLTFIWRIRVMLTQFFQPCFLPYISLQNRHRVFRDKFVFAFYM